MERGVRGDAIEVTVNGRVRSVATGLSVQGLLESLDLRPELIVVERNREILTRDRYAEEVLEAGDVIELVHFVGGG
ncbi:MAG: sulfur carrier protein ThiS [Gemmatimonadetes bacterium]|nr:sulfur carrier protein ThiS [Gemmatimonadota bacterium]NNF38689.1 sulfur carrier protein ThiS [Gemmatimonadota bacterium]NNK61777.1 sulfur carrier protein ThiS [Gemmatimonadota bacterium]